MDITPADRFYINLKKAQASYWRRKNPNPNPRGRPKKIKEEIPKNVEVVQKDI